MNSHAGGRARRAEYSVLHVRSDDGFVPIGIVGVRDQLAAEIGQLCLRRLSVQLDDLRGLWRALDLGACSERATERAGAQERRGLAGVSLSSRIFVANGLLARPRICGGVALLRGVDELVVQNEVARGRSGGWYAGTHDDVPSGGERGGAVLGSLLLRHGAAVNADVREVCTGSLGHPGRRTGIDGRAWTELKLQLFERVRVGGFIGFADPVSPTEQLQHAALGDAGCRVDRASGAAVARDPTRLRYRR